VPNRRLRGKPRKNSSSSSAAKTSGSAVLPGVPSSRRARSESHRREVSEVVDSLRRIVRVLHQSHRVAEQRWQLSAAQLLVLQRLAEAKTLSVNQLADRTFTHQSTVSVVVTRLVSRGLVRRSRADDDARRAELALTPAGRVLLQRAMTSALTKLMDALDDMPESRLRVIGGCLNRVVDALGVAEEPAGMFFEDGLAEEPNGKSRKGRDRS
jgi:MarR family transcriptional regulator, lower aerobic nicotinate degradation pathway regulator